MVQVHKSHEPSGSARCLIGQLEVDTRRLRLSSVDCHPQKLIGEISTGHLRFLSLAITTLQSRRVVIFIQKNPDIRFLCVVFLTTAIYRPTLRHVHLRQTYTGFFVFWFFLCILIPFYITKFSQSAVMAIDLPG